MERIPSFQVDHVKLNRGIYVSRLDKVNGNYLTSFDIRMKLPNREPVINIAELHTMEHLGATFLRNHSIWKDEIIYFGPMGCRTGFYLIMRDCMNVDAINLVKNSFEFVKNYEGDIPGNTKKECGNYLEHNLEKAKRDVVPLLNKLQNYTEEMLKY